MMGQCLLTVPLSALIIGGSMMGQCLLTISLSTLIIGDSVTGQCLLTVSLSTLIVGGSMMFGFCTPSLPSLETYHFNNW